MRSENYMQMLLFIYNYFKLKNNVFFYFFFRKHTHVSWRVIFSWHVQFSLEVREVTCSMS